MSEGLRPAILCASAALTHGGSESYALNLCHHLAQTVTVKFAAGRCGKKPFTDDFQRLSQIANIDLLTFPIIDRRTRFSEKIASSKINYLDLESLGIIPKIFNLKSFFKDVDVIEVNYPLEAMLFPFLPSRIKKIVHFHGPWLSPLVNRLKKILTPYVTTGITCSNWAKSELNRAWPDLNVEVVNNGVSCELFCPSDSQEKEKFSLNEKHDPSLPRFGTVARLSRAKGIHHLFNAAKKFQGVAEFFVVGSPDSGFSQELATYSDLKNFHILGPISNSRLPEFYNFIDCFVLPTLFENFPITVLEAMACGIPVISTHVGGIPEMVENGHTGILVPPDKIEPLITAMTEIIENERLAKEMGANGLATIKDRFTMEHSFKQTCQIYESIMRDSR